MSETPKAKKWHFILAAAFIGWCALEYFVLRGDVVLSRKVDVNEEVSIVFPVSNPNEPHFAQISLGRHKIEFELYDPDGYEVYSHDEKVVMEKPRRFEFTPTVSGNYELLLRRDEQGNYASVVPASVTILVNDYRLFTYLFGSDRGELF